MKKLRNFFIALSIITIIAILFTVWYYASLNSMNNNLSGEKLEETSEDAGITEYDVTGMSQEEIQDMLEKERAGESSE